MVVDYGVDVRGGDEGVIDVEMVGEIGVVGLGWILGVEFIV